MKFPGWFECSNCGDVWHFWVERDIEKEVCGKCHKMGTYVWKQ